MYILNRYNYNILGTTLWVPFYEQKYKENVEWLTNNIKNNENVIVLSHYLPSYKLIVPKYWTKEYEPLQKQYASDLEHLMKPNVKFWLCGHSHSKL
jgi:Icc-related predicted phosphoesterase